MNDRPPTVLFVGGVDPSGEAGLSADLRASIPLGIFPRILPTCLTVQNSSRFELLHPVPLDLFRRALGFLLEEGVDAVKVGVLPFSGGAWALLEEIPPSIPLVFDPVLSSSTGGRLVPPDLLGEIRDLARRSTLVTPNREEAREIFGGEGVGEARRWVEEGGGAVLLKGGHDGGEWVEDTLILPQRVLSFRRRRDRGALVRGKGCFLSSLVASHLAQGYSLEDSVEEALLEFDESFRSSFEEKGGRAIPSRFLPLLPDARKEDPSTRSRLAQTSRAVREGISFLSREALPEVGSNLSFLPEDGDVSRGVALSFRVVRSGKGIAVGGPLEVGGRHHTLRIARAAWEHDPSIRSAMNVRLREEYLDRARKEGWRIGSFDRSKEPPESPSTVEWGIHEALQGGFVPDLVVDDGGWGKEGMIRVLGRDPQEVVEKVRRLLGRADPGRGKG